MGYHRRAVPCIKAAHNNINAIKNDSECHFQEDDIKLIEAVLTRANGDFKTAANQYRHLMPKLNQNQDEHFREILLNTFCMLLETDRKMLSDSLVEIKTYFELLHDENLYIKGRAEDDLLLSHYTIKTDSC